MAKATSTLEQSLFNVYIAPWRVTKYATLGL